MKGLCGLQLRYRGLRGVFRVLTTVVGIDEKFAQEHLFLPLV